MSVTPSSMMPLGTVAPSFNLPDTGTGKMVSLEDHKAPATVITFMCNHCPYVVHIIDEIVNVATENVMQNVRFIAISSNDVANYPQDGPEQMTQFAKDHDFTFPYLYDETQDVAKAYNAECTPEFYVFDADLKCVYRGRFDSATPGNKEPINGGDLRSAINRTLAGEDVTTEQMPSIGCNIKWK